MDMDRDIPAVHEYKLDAEVYEKYNDYHRQRRNQIIGLIAFLSVVAMICTTAVLITFANLGVFGGR